MEQEISVRIGTPSDVDGMMALAMAATEENAFISPSPKKLLESIWPALNRKHGLVGIIGMPEERLEGAILLNIGEMWYSEIPVIEEKAIFVHPDFRAAKGGRARHLAEFAKKVSNELSMPLAIGVLSNSRTEAKIRLYERVFGSPAGVYFLYGAKTGLNNKIDGA